MKKTTFTALLAAVLATACDRTTSCTCKDTSGDVIKYSSLTSNRRERNEFNASCRQLKILSYDDTTRVYLPCEVTD